MSHRQMLAVITFNRTIVELKPRIAYNCLMVNPSFNRTIVELKLKEKHTPNQ